MELVHLVLEQFYFNELFHFFQVIRFSSVVAGSKHLFWLLGRGVCVCGVLVAQPCLTLCGPMACTQTRSSVHGLLQARILEWVAIPFSRGSFWPRDKTQVSSIASRFLTIWATRLNHLLLPWSSKTASVSSNFLRVVDYKADPKLLCNIHLFSHECFWVPVLLFTYFQPCDKLVSPLLFFSLIRIQYHECFS